jgi:hypothetical protein
MPRGREEWLATALIFEGAGASPLPNPEAFIVDFILPKRFTRTVYRVEEK